MPFLRSHLYQHIQSPDVGRHAHQALARIDRIMAQGQDHATRMRKDVPCAAELHAGEVRGRGGVSRAAAWPRADTPWSAQHMHSVIVRIYFLDGSHIYVPVDPWTTFR